jgi:copper chaperone CopZ
LPGNVLINSKGGSALKKTMVIEGMSCAHCKKRVENALNAIAGVSCEVDLEQKTANLTLSFAVDDETLKRAVEDAGYTVLAIR